MRAGPATGGTAFSGLGIALLVGVTLGWGFNWPVMKIALDEIPPWTFRAITVPSAGVVLLAWARLAGLSLAVPRAHWPALAAVTFFNITGWHVASAYAIGFLGANRAVLIAFTMPLWASLLGVVFLGEAMGWRRFAALVLGMGGIAALMGEDFAAVGKAPLGGGLMLAAALAWAAGTVMIKRLNWKMSVLSFTAWQLTIGGLPIAVGALAVEAPALRPPSLLAAAAVLYTMVGATALCTYGWFRIVSLFPASVSAIGTLMVPVVGVVSGNLVLGEPLGWRELVALALVVSSLALTLFKPSAVAGKP